MTSWLSAMSYQLRAMSYQLSAKKFILINLEEAQKLGTEGI